MPHINFCNFNHIKNKHTTAKKFEQWYLSNGIVIYPFYAKHKDPEGYDVTFIVDNTGIAICYSKDIDSERIDEFYYFIQCDLDHTLAKLICYGLEEIDIDQYLDDVKQYYTRHEVVK